MAVRLINGVLALLVTFAFLGISLRAVAPTLFDDRPIALPVAIWTTSIVAGTMTFLRSGRR